MNFASYEESTGSPRTALIFLCLVAVMFSYISISQMIGREGRVLHQSSDCLERSFPKWPV